MNYGLSNLSVIPLRSEANDRSEMVSQVIYGETFKIIETNKKWSRISLSFDQYEGWIDNKQFLKITKVDFDSLEKLPRNLSTNFVDIIITAEKELFSIYLGSQIQVTNYLNHQFEGNSITGEQPKSSIPETAQLYLNSPYLWGGKTQFGVDCSGFTQMVYKLNGYKLFRDANQQATQGDSLSFIDESEPGDLALFDNEEGNIIHVGIIMKDNYIIHAHGKVRIDRLDQTGIFNNDTRKHTHKLRVIKRII